MNVMSKPAVVPDYAAIKAKQNATWSSGDYARIGTSLQIVGEQLAEALDLAPDAKVVDVAAGNGNATLAFARRGCDVTSTDYVEKLLAAGAGRAMAEVLPVKFQVADAEALPFKSETFDGVVSTFGVMFAPNQPAAAAEMVRVCRSGGRIGLANWTPEGFIGQVFKTIGRHVTPPAGLDSPARWGSRDWIADVFGPHAAKIAIEDRDFVFRYRSPSHFIDYFRTYYGPMHKAYLALEPAAQAALTADLEQTIARFDDGRNGNMRVASGYVEVVIDKA